MARLHGVDDLIRNLEKWGKQREHNVITASKTAVAPMLERYAKANRPWKDRTGRAKQGLHAKVVTSSSDIAIQLHHGVHYGVYLELSKAGKYAILRPTIDRNKAEIIRILRSAWGD